jgi:hypothetical protein
MWVARRAAGAPFAFRIAAAVAQQPDAPPVQIGESPKLPVALAEGDTQVSRWIVPLLGQPKPTLPSDTTWAFGDLLLPAPRVALSRERFPNE